MTKMDGLVATGKPSMRDQLGTRHVYVNPGHHDPSGGIVPYNPEKTVIPENHLELFNKAIPYQNPNNGRVTYYAKDSSGNFHRFQPDGKGPEYHWNGQTNGRTKSGHPTDNIPVPTPVLQRLK